MRSWAFGPPTVLCVSTLAMAPCTLEDPSFWFGTTGMGTGQWPYDPRSLGAKGQPSENPDVSEYSGRTPKGPDTR